jgi:PAS domain S-box-containing protein
MAGRMTALERAEELPAALQNETESVREGASERRYRLLAELITSIVWNTTASGEVISELPSWSAFTGQTLAEARGWGWLNAIHPDDRAQTMSDWSVAFAAKSAFRSENRVRRHDGEYRNMLSRAVPILDGRGAIVEWTGANIDVTEQKRAQEALAESERFVRSALDSLSAHIAILDENGTILAVNKVWRDFALANAAKANAGAGANYLTICDTASGPRCEESAAVAHGIRAVLRGEQKKFSLEYPCDSPAHQAIVHSPSHTILRKRTYARGRGP